MSLLRGMMAAGGGGGGPTAETVLWESRINALGGSVTAPEYTLADNLILAIQAASYGSKIVYLLPFIGASIAAHRVPLRDTIGVGAAINTGFTDADCDTASGIQNPTEAAKWLNTGIEPETVGVSQAIGYGFWERNIGFGTNVEPMGCYDSTSGTGRSVLDLRNNLQRFSHGNVSTTSAAVATTAANAHYYGQRASGTDRQLYRDATSIASNTVNNGGFNTGNTNTVHVMGCRNNSSAIPWKGRCAVAYITDGTLSGADITALHALLGTYLITPTGR